MITLLEENHLIDRILAGERQCYATLVDHYKSYAFTIALKIVNNRPEAEEVAQDAFIKAFHYLKNFNRQAKFSTWLYRIVFNTAISYRRKNRKLFQSLDDNMVDRAHVVPELEKEDKKLFIARAMEQLNETDRVAIQLFYLQEFSLDEVAGMMEQNPNTIKVRIHRARLRLADELRRMLKEEALTL